MFYMYRIIHIHICIEYCTHIMQLSICRISDIFFTIHFYANSSEFPLIERIYLAQIAQRQTLTFSGFQLIVCMKGKVGKIPVDLVISQTRSLNKFLGISLDKYIAGQCEYSKWDRLIYENLSFRNFELYLNSIIQRE